MSSKPIKILREAILALEKLEVTEGRLGKEAILETHRDNKALRSLVKMAIGTDRYFVRPSVNILCNSTLGPLASWRAFRALTEKLKHRKVTGNEAKAEVQRFLSSCYPQLMKWYCRVLNHDLRIGVDKLTIEKVWGDDFLLSDSAQGTAWRFHGCALAKKYEDVYKETKKGFTKPTFPQAMESKFDGERALLICFPADETVYVLTRSGRRRKPVEGVATWCTQVLDFCRALNADADPNRPLFLDGEFLARKWNDTSSIVRKTKNFNPEIFLKDVRVFLWDWAPLDQYLAGCFDVKWIRRKSMLLHAAGATRPTRKNTRFTRNVWVTGHVLVYDEAQMQAEYEVALDAGYEGSMLKDPEAAHTFKRNKHLVKLKPEDEITGRIVDVHPGKDANDSVPPAVRGKVKKAMRRAGKVQESPQYLYCKTEEHEELIKHIKGIISGDNEQRIHMQREDVVGFRHGKRLGYLVVELDDGQHVRVGGGFKFKAGNDERALLWRKRDEIVGMRVDFKQQRGDTADAVSRFPRFVRLREDLS